MANTDGKKFSTGKSLVRCLHSCQQAIIVFLLTTRSNSLGLTPPTHYAQHMNRDRKGGSDIKRKRMSGTREGDWAEYNILCICKKCHNE